MAKIFQNLDALGLVLGDLIAERIGTDLTGLSEKSVGFFEFDIQDSD